MVLILVMAGVKTDPVQLGIQAVQAIQLTMDTSLMESSMVGKLVVHHMVTAGSHGLLQILVFIHIDLHLVPVISMMLMHQLMIIELLHIMDGLAVVAVLAVGHLLVHIVVAVLYRIALPVIFDESCSLNKTTNDTLSVLLT